MIFGSSVVYIRICNISLYISEVFLPPPQNLKDMQNLAKRRKYKYFILQKALNCSKHLDENFHFQPE